MSKKRDFISSKQRIRQLERELKAYHEKENGLLEKESLLVKREQYLEEKEKQIAQIQPPSIAINEKNNSIISSLNSIEENLNQTKALFSELKILKNNDYRKLMLTLVRIHRKFYCKIECEMIIGEIEELCGDLGLKQIEPKCGDAFNGKLHEKNDSNLPTGHISMCIAPGWSFQDDIIMRALVEIKNAVIIEV